MNNLRTKDGVQIECLMEMAKTWIDAAIFGDDDFRLHKGLLREYFASFVFKRYIDGYFLPQKLVRAEDLVEGETAGDLVFGAARGNVLPTSPSITLRVRPIWHEVLPSIGMRDEL